jgi:pyruvate formate lyase activating enzyme
MPVTAMTEGRRMSHVAMLFGLGTEVLADELQIAGFEPFSSVDWPGKLVATVFAQGCPWQCTYCHNTQMQDSQVPGTVEWSTVLAHLASRTGKLDGIVFSGGEPTRQAALVPAMQQARALGFGVGLHTAGAYPARLREALPFVDWLGLDIKAMPEGYQDITGKQASGAKAWQALEIALEWGGELEVRLTVDPTTHTRDGVLSIVRRVQAMGGPTPVLQEARGDGTSEEFQHALGGQVLTSVLSGPDLEGLTVRR